jgi:hypothetical protein
VQRIGTTNPAIHYFYKPTGNNFGDEATFLKQGSAQGLGDVDIRLKGFVVRRPTLGMAMGVEARLPTGDEENLLGSGALSLKPFLVLSAPHGAFSPHLNAAYQVNGKSLLAGNVETGQKADLPDQALLAVGADIGIGKKGSIAIDVIGRRVIDGERVNSTTFTALNGTSKFPNISFTRGSYNVIDGAVGFKVNPGAGLLISLNVTFKLNDTGLRDRVTPLLGMEYSF